MNPKLDNQKREQGAAAVCNICTRCLRKTKVCLCHMVQPFKTSTFFVILMHQKEFRDRRGTGTARLAHLALTSSKIFTGLDFSQEHSLNAMLNHPSYCPVVLFPGVHSLNLSTQEGLAILDCQRGSKRLVLIVLDGSWSCAKKILKQNPKIAALPRVSFVTTRKSKFTFKRQPRAECLSTLEAIDETLELFQLAGIEGPEIQMGCRNLIGVFDELVRLQRGFSPDSTTRRAFPSHPENTGTVELNSTTP